MTATQATPPLTAKQAIDWSKVVEAHRDWIKRLVVAVRARKTWRTT